MIDEIIKQLKPLINGKLIYLSQYGSHLYGLNTENSDLDFRGVYIPTLDDIILHKDKDEINTEIELFHYGDIYELPNNLDNIPTMFREEMERVKVDVKIFSLQKFIQLCSKADTNALDLLFSYNQQRKDIQQYVYNKEQYYENGILAHPYIPFIEFLINRGKLINTDRLESPITYAFKQATKYGLKGERLKILELVEQKAKYLKKKNKTLAELRTVVVEDLIDYTDLMELKIPNNHIRIDVLDNKGKKEKYLFVCGVQHQFNLDLDKFIKRIEEKINKEYTSQRTIDAKDGNDWKALSHAIRVLLEVKELLDTGNIQFPLKDKEFLLDIKLGKVEREYIDNFFNQELSNILERVQKNELNWKYDEEFWNEFILQEVKNV